MFTMKIKLQTKGDKKMEKPVKLIVTRTWNGWKNNSDGELVPVSKKKSNTFYYENEKFALIEMKNFKAMGCKVKLV
tara:strand:+ start:373 stop:600 length:228 start_codon:yes stop_codon:yes gene_type:complete